MTGDENKDQGPFGDVRPQPGAGNPEVNPSLPQEDVSDRDNVSIVAPEDYPPDEREAGNVSGLQGNPPSYGDGAASEYSNDPEDYEDDEALDDDDERDDEE